MGIDNTKQVAESKLVQTQELPLDNGGELVQTGLDILKNSDGDREMAVYYFRKAAKEGDSQGEYLLGNHIMKVWEFQMIISLQRNGLNCLWSMEMLTQWKNLLKCIIMGLV